MSKRSRPFALIVVLVAGALATVLTGAATPMPVAPFTLSGHWVFNSLLQVVFHIDGGTGNIDAHADVSGEPGSQVLQSDTHGYVVGPAGITEFDKAKPAEQQAITTPVRANELPVTIEAAGGPYLVYRDAGMVARLGDPPTVIPLGGAVSTPVVTANGTMWLHRQDDGQICTLDAGALQLSHCPVTAPPGHAGALTIVDQRPVFLDMFTATLHVVEGDKLGTAIPLGVPLSPNARLASHDLAGRVVVFDPQRPSMLLADIHSPPQEAIPVALPVGDYDGPVSTGDVVVLLDRQSGTVLTYGADGVRKDSKQIKERTRTPRISRGEDNRVYVEDYDGTQVVVVSGDGAVLDVPTAERPKATQPPALAVSNNRTPATNGPVPALPQAQQPRQRQQTPVAPRTPPTAPTAPAAATTTAPPPVPAGRPGAPPSVAAQAGNSSAVVTWGTAVNNRAAVTSHVVSWQGGSVTVGGGERRATINGLSNGVRYVFTVAAVNRVGTGPGASSNPVNPVQPQTRSVTVSRGKTERYNQTCEVPECGKMRVVMRGFEPRKRYKIIPYSTANYSNEGSSQTTDRNGNLTFEAFHFGKVGATVWVVVDGQYTSNRYTWVSG